MRILVSQLPVLVQNERMFDRLRYLIMLKSNISYVYSNNYMKIKINSDEDLPLEKSLNKHNLVMLLSQFLMKIIIIITCTCFWENAHTN